MNISIDQFAKEAGVTAQVIRKRIISGEIKPIAIVEGNRMCFRINTDEYSPINHTARKSGRPPKNPTVDIIKNQKYEIGDFIYLNGKIRMLSDGSLLRMKFTEEGAVTKIDDKEVKPIELNEWWLDWLGFVTKSRRMWSRSNVTVTRNAAGAFIFNHRKNQKNRNRDQRIKVEFVHQLQNLYFNFEKTELRVFIRDHELKWKELVGDMPSKDSENEIIQSV